eukprot:2009288-Karenia_brevis.AAC.1
MECNRVLERSAQHSHLSMREGATVHVAQLLNEMGQRLEDQLQRSHLSACENMDSAACGAIVNKCAGMFGVLNFKVATSACQKGRQSQRLAQLLNEVQQSAECLARRNHISMKKGWTVAACGASAQWTRSFCSHCNVGRALSALFDANAEVAEASARCGSSPQPAMHRKYS